MEELRQAYLSGERALFSAEDLRITDSLFDDGESPLKHSKGISIENSMFRWKYPLWYSRDIDVRNCSFFETARAGIWYTERISVSDTMIEAPKAFRRCTGVNLKRVSFLHAAETLWNCRDLSLRQVTAKGDYFAMNCTGAEIDRLELAGNYSFDGCRDLLIRNSRLLSKDAFWNCENVTVTDSFISGEYFGWNSRNITLENCTVESLQGFCYIENLVMRNCKLINTTLAFEYSTVDAEIVSHIDSVKNPSGGRICAPSVGELILDPERIDPDATEIILTAKT